MRAALISIVFILSIQLNAQHSINSSQEDFIENYIQSIESEGEFDFAFLFEELSYLYNQPLNINGAGYDDFKKLFILDDIQINDILNHRQEFGDFIELYELQTIPSLTIEDIKNIQPFLSVGSEINSPLSIKEMITASDHTLYGKWRRVLETQKGYTDEATENSRYLGGPNRLYMRYQMRFADKLKFGLTMEKDEGEPILNSTQRGFDYHSFHLYLKDYSPRIKDLVIGDFTANLGQGLILHNGFGSGKSSYVMDVKKGGRALKSYTSLNETNFYRGIGLTSRLSKSIDITAFASKKDIDANQSLVPNDDGFDFFTSVLNNGLHRSVNERSKINAVNEVSLGGRVTFNNNNNIRVNYNILYSHFNKLFQRRTNLYNQFLFSGSNLTNQSIDYSYKLRNLNFYGESAISNNLSMAHLHGVLIGLNRLADVSILYRNYDKSYQSLFSNSFGESRNTNNEKGLYIGFKLKPTNQFTISAYADQWSHEWLRFRADSPSKGREYLVKLNYYVRRKVTFYLQYKYEQKEQNSTDPDLKIDQLVPIQIEKYRAHLSYKINESIELRSRIELSHYKEESQNDLGYLVYQDILLKPLSSSFSINGRVAYFHTPGFDTRIYTYESDLLYEYFVPSFSDQGLRYYTNLRYDVMRGVTLEFRLAQTRYMDRETIGSSNSLIDGNTKTQVKAQFRIKF